VRARSGIVQRVDSDLLSSAIVLSSPWFTRYAGKPERPPADKEQYGLGPFHRLYRLRDGWIYVVAETEDQRRAMCSTFGCAEPEPSPRQQSDGRHPNATPLAMALATAIARRSTHETLAALRAGGVPCSEVLAAHSEAFLEDPHARANDLVAVCQHPKVGTLRMAWQLVQFARTRSSGGLPTPLLGQHTSTVLGELGYSESEIRSLHADGVIRTEGV
jgi:crotonobetainyl-CoA:carnitine CoA-transferase CaiB-like acyl-CoA transferase